MDFENFYITWYSRVKYFARDYVLSDEEAENIAQDVFLEFYQREGGTGFPYKPGCLFIYLCEKINVSIIYGGD